MLALFMEECAGCSALEERTFRDSWTGKELCAVCLGKIIDLVTNSPCSDGDNLIQLLINHDICDEDELKNELFDERARNKMLENPSHKFV